jgi:hypothetical protein
MPVTIIRNPSPMRVSNRSKPFNAAVRALAPRIAEVRKEGARSAILCSRAEVQ